MGGHIDLFGRFPVEVEHHRRFVAMIIVVVKCLVQIVIFHVRKVLQTRARVQVSLPFLAFVVAAVGVLHLLDGLADEFDLLEALGVALVFDLDGCLGTQNLRLLDGNVLPRDVVGAGAALVPGERLLVVSDKVVISVGGATREGGLKLLLSELFLDS